MTFRVEGSFEGKPYRADWADGSLRADLSILQAVPVEGEEWRYSPVGPFYTWTETDPVVVYAWLWANTQIVDVYGDPPAWKPPVPSAEVVA